MTSSNSPRDLTSRVVAVCRRRWALVVVPLVAAATAALATQVFTGDLGDVVVPVLVALVAGLLVGLLAVLVVELVDGSIRDQHALAKLTGVANLAVVARHPIGAQRPDDVAAFRDPNSIEAEGYRSLRTALEFVLGHRTNVADANGSTPHSTVDPGDETDTASSSSIALAGDDEAPAHTGPGTIVLVTSPRPGEGKSTVAANLAAVSAMAGRRVVLIDGDLRKPQVHRLFRLKNEVGLSSVLAGEAMVAGAVRRLGTLQNLAVMSAGPPPPDPAELLANGRLASALSSLAQVADLVVVDAPPLLAVTDATIIVQHCDVVVLVATADLSDRREWAEALPRLAVVDAMVAGTVLLQPDDRVQAVTTYRYTPSAVPQNWWVAAPSGPAASAPTVPEATADEPAVREVPVDEWSTPNIEPISDESANTGQAGTAGSPGNRARVSEGWPQPSSER